MAKKTIIFSKDLLYNDDGMGGLEIKIPGFIGNPSNPKTGQIYMEYTDNTLVIRVWNNKTKATTFKFKPIKRISK